MINKNELLKIIKLIDYYYKKDINSQSHVINRISLIKGHPQRSMSETA